ncbi:hypothetical protein [Clostridium botulinum]|uniref:hypothetical protein n=1 Tax=Clostridium botulinum TaxID=1491 RepID=UPI0004B70FCD|nr:hypothetical protein [Clostridium botulinum]MBN3402920.1 hypothetical protein [Clostridium botulinum]MBN3447571.1 hypothetical protein [Clostridium botulinum]MBY6842698.1 hypothetical protein [Clostridium botulinum]QDY27121.1 hypothetical protein CGQ40_20670 [Clostridium botulinum]
MIKKIFSDNTKDEINKFLSNSKQFTKEFKILDKSDDTYILGIDLAKQDEYDCSCVCYMRCNKNGTFTIMKSEIFKGDDYNKLGFPSKTVKI